MKDTAALSATGSAELADEAATTCVAALDSIVRLSEMSAATRGAITQLRELAQICGEANRVIVSIREDLAREEAGRDPVRLADALERLHRMSAIVRAATDSADETIEQSSAVNR